MKRFLSLSLALVLLCAFSGCSEPAETAAEPTPSPSPAAASASPAAKTISAPQPRSFTVDRALLPADAEDYLATHAVTTTRCSTPCAPERRKSPCRTPTARNAAAEVFSASPYAALACAGDRRRRRRDDHARRDRLCGCV